MPLIANTEPGWYCLKALPKKEHIAALSLAREMQMECFCPRIRYEKKTRRGKVHFIECLFPGYVFVHTDLRVTYRQMRSIRGIRDVVAFGDRVPRIPDEFMEALRTGLDKEALKEVPAPVLTPGREVVIIEGPFKDLNAVISGQLDGQQRVAILLEFLGRQMEIKIPASKVLLQDDNPRQRAME